MTRRKVALVTGAGRRLGRQIAYALARANFDIVVNYHKSKQGAEEAVRYIKDLGNDAVAIKADVSSKQQVHQMIEKIIKYFKTIDVLVNNSSIFLYSPLSNTTEVTWNRSIDINLKGPFLCSQFVSRIMLRRKQGRIINIASLGGIQAWENYLPYSVSKAGVIMLTRCLARALAPTIMVNAIAPGSIVVASEESPRQRHVPISRIPLGRYGKPEDITNAVLFLATTSQYITGQTFTIDGGRAI